MSKEEARARWAVKEQVLERDGYKCQREKGGSICGRTERLTMHHIVPQRLGGATTVENCVTWCEDCHAEFNSWEAKSKQRAQAIHRQCRWNIDWECKPGCTKCQNCHRFVCDNWPEGFVEALVRLLCGDFCEVVA